MVDGRTLVFLAVRMILWTDREHLLKTAFAFNCRRGEIGRLSPSKQPLQQSAMRDDSGEDNAEETADFADLRRLVSDGREMILLITRFECFGFKRVD